MTSVRVHTIQRYIICKSWLREYGIKTSIIDVWILRNLQGRPLSGWAVLWGISAASRIWTAKQALIVHLATTRKWLWTCRRQAQYKAADDNCGETPCCALHDEGAAYVRQTQRVGFPGPLRIIIIIYLHTLPPPNLPRYSFPVVGDWFRLQYDTKHSELDEMRLLSGDFLKGITPSSWVRSETIRRSRDHTFWRASFEQAIGVTLGVCAYARIQYSYIQLHVYLLLAMHFFLILLYILFPHTVCFI